MLFTVLQTPSLFGSPSFSSFPGVSSVLHIYFYSSLYSDVVLKLDLVCECVEVEQSENAFLLLFLKTLGNKGKNPERRQKIGRGVK